MAPLVYFHASGGGYIIFYNSCPLSDTSIVCENRKYKQLNFFININNFLFVTFIWAVICKYEGPSWSLYLAYVFILSHISLVSMATHAIVNGWYGASVKYCWLWEPLFQLFTQQEVLSRFPHKPDFYFLWRVVYFTYHTHKPIICFWPNSNIVTQRINLFIFRLTEQCCLLSNMWCPAFISSPLSSRSSR